MNQPISGAEDNQSKNFIEVEGAVEQLLPGAKFRITLSDGNEIIAYLGGQLRIHRIKIIPGDRVRVQISPYDLKRGRVVYRL
ncbi:MAG: translation initiation factor IF-1 [Parcubacteria group bacterium]|nr:translation initiation factor IF-1 [Parcubacteria group bacterium]